MRNLLIALVLLLAAVPAMPQGVSYNSQAFTFLQQNPNNAVQYIPNANVSVCIGTSLPPFGATCTGTLASLFQDVSLSVPANNPATTDQNGNFQFFVAQGLYVVSIWKPGFVTYSYVITLTGPGALTGPFTSSFFSSSSTSPAASGVFRLASGDLGPCYRNQANTADLCWSKNSVDVFSPPGGIASTFNNFWSGAQNFSGPMTFSGSGNIGTLGLGSTALSANNSWLGTQTFVGTTLRTINTSTVYADQLTPSIGLCGVSGSDASAKIQCAIGLLPASGGVVNAINLSDAGGTGSTIIDPGAKSVTLYLGPYIYQIQQVVLETNFHIIGMGTGSRSPSDTSTTVLQACATCASTNAIVLGTNGGIGGPTQHVLMDGLRIYGTTSDTGIGMNLKTVNGSGTGIWYSTFRNICVGVCGPSGASANGFSGGALILDATGTGTINQFLDFYNVQAFKTNGGGFALGLLGTDGQINFTQCEFDGPTRNDGTIVVQIANTVAANAGPYSISFIGATVQHGTVGVNIAGAFQITFIGTHFETVGQAITINAGTAGFVTDVTFMTSTCQNFCGNNTGTGWWAKNLSPATGTYARFIGNQIQSTVDATYIGFTNNQALISIGDEQNSATTVTPLTSVGNNIPLLTAFTTTAVSSESVTVTGATASSHCWAEPTNATAAALTGVFLSAPTTNAITLNHSATSGGTFNVFCTPN